MKIAWLFPVDQKCGISYYSHDYVNALAESTDVEIFDIYECLANIPSYSDRLNSFDIIHIQYETSFFLKGNSKKFKGLCGKIKKPVVVSLHEVYEEFPGVFPRSQIKGSGFTRKCKEFIYDMRHPYQTTYLEHASQGFFADALIVHANFQKEILLKKSIPEKKISVIPMPVKAQNTVSGTSKTDTEILKLASLGFINQNYNYPLLFDALDSLEIPWSFTWIGGMRRDEDVSLLNTINREIEKRNWQDTFTITGWIPEDTMNQLLFQTDIYLALFSERSSSASLATALGARKVIIALSIPLTQEMVKSSPVMKLASPDCKSVTEAINQLSSDKSLRESYLAEIDRYITLHSYNEMAKRLLTVYQELTV
jgi:hypothetical protein